MVELAIIPTKWMHCYERSQYINGSLHRALFMFEKHLIRHAWCTTVVRSTNAWKYECNNLIFTCTFTSKVTKGILWLQDYTTPVNNLRNVQSYMLLYVRTCTVHYNKGYSTCARWIAQGMISKLETAPSYTSWLLPWGLHITVTFIELAGIQYTASPSSYSFALTYRSADACCQGTLRSG